MADTNRVGQVLAGKLRVLSILATGGMGAVYLAEHLQLGKRVAVKFLRTDHLDEESVRRFSQEARAAAAIGHRGIIDVYDIGTSDDGAPYIVMELLAGESLGDALSRTAAFPVHRAVWIMSRVLSALEAAHETGIVHRDLKPDNVFLVGPNDAPEDVKLLDFGISKMLRHPDRDLTGPGVAVGTVDYMAPEQARGAKDLDPRVDVWAAGVLLYQLLTGRHPFADDTDTGLGVLSRILSQAPVPPRSRRPDLPEGLEAAVLGALQKERNQRTGSARELAAAIAPWTAEAPVPSDGRDRLSDAPTVKAEVPPRAAPVLAPTTGHALVGRSRPTVWAIGAAAVLAIGAVAAWAVQPKARERAAHRAEAASERSATAENVTTPRADSAARGVAVLIELTGVTNGARVFFDGAEVDGRSIRVAPRSVMVPLRVESAGHEPFAKMITPDRDQVIEVTLRPIARGPRRARPDTPRGTRILTDTDEFARPR